MQPKCKKCLAAAEQNETPVRRTRCPHNLAQMCCTQCSGLFHFILGLQFALKLHFSLAMCVSVRVWANMQYPVGPANREQVPVFVIFEAVNFKLKSIFHPSICRMPGKYWMSWATTRTIRAERPKGRGIPPPPVCLCVCVCATAVACLTSFAADTCLMFYCCLTGNALRCNCNCIRLKLINCHTHTDKHTQWRKWEREREHAHRHTDRTNPLQVSA